MRKTTNEQPVDAVEYVYEYVNETDDSGETEYEYVEVDGDAFAAAGSAGHTRPKLLKRPLRWFAWFRRTRPFWGAIILGFGAYFIGYPVTGGGFKFVANIGKDAMLPLGLALVMAAAALMAIVTPKQRHFPAIVAMLAAIASLPLANLGGFLIGMLFGIVGAGLIFAWTPYSDKQLERFAAKAADKAARKAAKKGLNAPTAVAA